MQSNSQLQTRKTGFTWTAPPILCARPESLTIHAQVNWDGFFQIDTVCLRSCWNIETLFKAMNFWFGVNCKINIHPVATKLFQSLNHFCLQTVKTLLKKDREQIISLFLCFMLNTTNLIIFLLWFFCISTLEILILRKDHLGVIILYNHVK